MSALLAKLLFGGWSEIEIVRVEVGDTGFHIHAKTIGTHTSCISCDAGKTFTDLADCFQVPTRGTTVGLGALDLPSYREAVFDVLAGL
jgi:hypothetical protein